MTLINGPEATQDWNSAWAPSGEADAHGHVEPNGGEADFGFADLLDVINPLHHLPVVGSMYREMTGDQIEPAARSAGSFLWGGPIGLLASVVNNAVEAETGTDVAGNAIAWMNGDPSQTPTLGAEEVVLAANPDETAPSTSGTSPLETEAMASFEGASAARLDAFLKRQPAAAPQMPSDGRATDWAAMDAATLRRTLKVDLDRALPPEPSPQSNDASVVVGSPVTSKSDVGNWMVQALEKYNRLQTTGTG